MTLPGDPPGAAGRLHLITETRREIEDIFVGLGFNVAEGPEVEYDYYNFTSLNHPPGHPARMLQDTFYFSDDVLLRTHTSPMQTRAMEAQEPPLYIVIPGKVYRRDSDATHTPMFHQVEGLAVDEDITLADLQGVLLEFARAIFGPEREIRLRPHYFPFTEPSVEVDVSCFDCGGTGVLPDGARDNLCKGSGWIEILGSGMVDPNVFGFVGLRPRALPGLRVRDGHRAHRDAQARRPRPAHVLRQRRPLPGAVRMRVPVAWLREYCSPDLSTAEIAERFDLTGTEVARIERVGVGDPDGFVVGRVLEAEQHPDADRLTVCKVDVGEGEPETIVCGAPNVAAGQIVAVARPGAVMPDGTKLGRGEAARRRVEPG